MKFKIFIYTTLSKFFHIFFNKNYIKKVFELLYWKSIKLKEKEFSNDHYEYFYTDFFNIKKEFYNNKKIIDIGCGPRGSLEWANKAKKRIGIDTLANKYKKIQNKNCSMDYFNAFSEDIPFDNNYFDVVTSFNSLNHVDDVGKTLTEIYRILKPDGIFLLITDIFDTPTICEPSAFGWEISKSLCAKFNKQFEKHFEGNKMYTSIRNGVEFDHKNNKKRNGILAGKYLKINDNI